MFYNISVEKFGLASKTGEILYFAILFFFFAIVHGLVVPTGYKESVLVNDNVIEVK